MPEWEIEEAVAWQPDLINVGPITNPALLDRQRHLSSLDGYIDLLLSAAGRYIVVELKGVFVDDPKVVSEQVIKYRSALAEELKVRPETIESILASPFGFSSEVLAACNRYRVFAKVLDLDALQAARPQAENSLLKFVSTSEQLRLTKIRTRRRRSLRAADLTFDLDPVNSSVKTWISQQVHDETALSQIASLFKLISARAPIQAHEILTDGNGRLETNDHMWFWLFYSVLDRRANATTFVKAKRILTDQELFKPQDIIAYEKNHGETATLDRVVSSLETQGFPLSGDSTLGKRAKPKSILESAKLVAKYRYDFRVWFATISAQVHGDPQKTFETLWSELIEKIYGVGPRIASQFIRGMVLKGPWRLPLSDTRLLERCRFNDFFAGPARFCLVQKGENYESKLGEFADKYLEGNRAVVSHVLWYIRKRYCDKVPICWECPLAGYCSYYARAGYQREQRGSMSKGRPLSHKEMSLTALDKFVR